MALMILAQVFAHVGETNHAETAFVEAAGIAEQVDDPLLRARTTRAGAWTRYLHGRFEESLALSRRGLEIGRREGSDGRYGVHLLDGVFEDLIELGRWPEALLAGDQITARMTRSLEMLGVHGSRARVFTLQGRFTDAEPEIARAAEFDAVGPHRVWQLEDAIFHAYQTGHHGGGRDLMEAALTASPEPDRDAILWWPLHKAIAGEAYHAEAARRRRRDAEAEDAVAAGRRYADILSRSARAAIEADGGGPMVRAYVRSVDAELRRLEGHSDPLRWAAVADARIDVEQPWELAYARYRQAEALLASGAPAAEAAAHLREAHSIASGLGAGPLRIAVEGLASRARIRIEDAGSVPDTDTPASMLTAREIEVLTLVAAGHTNREIGSRLFISEKTASVHVTHAMSKLGALSRYEAAAAASRLGLLEPASVP